MSMPKMRRSLQAQPAYHFKMEGLHTIQQLLHRIDYITKVDLSDFYMHFFIGEADCKYMRCMWVGQEVSMHEHAL